MPTIFHGGTIVNIDKAYILGLVVGGGVFGSSTSSFCVKLPYKQINCLV